MNAQTCAKCSGRMQPGFFMDRLRRGYGNPSLWIEGEPERSLWFGTKTRGKACFAVVAYRCERCGWLELYAPPG